MSFPYIRLGCLLRIALWLGLAAATPARAANPYLPAYEYIPDGEPRVFGDRVYVYGSHDTAGSAKYCDTKLRVWSAPLSDLNNWRDEGDSFHSKADAEHADDVPWSDSSLYAPDVVEKGGKYYLYFYVVGAAGGVAVSDTPAGPFKLVSKIVPPAGSPTELWRQRTISRPRCLGGRRWLGLSLLGLSAQRDGADEPRQHV